MSAVQVTFNTMPCIATSYLEYVGHLLVQQKSPAVRDQPMMVEAQMDTVFYISSEFYFRTVFDECLDDIPSAGAPLDKFLCCDVCMRKEDRRRLAQIYCVICSKKFCTPHEKVSLFDSLYFSGVK